MSAGLPQPRPPGALRALLVLLVGVTVSYS